MDEIKWGQEWKKAIDKGLADAAFFIPVITPGYLYSGVCREEFEKFAAFEKKRGRTDLILPLIFVRPEDFDDKDAGKRDLVIRLCLERQYVNWEDLRGLGDEGPEYRTRLTTLSKRIRELLKTLTTSLKAKPATAKARKKPTASNKRRALPQKADMDARSSESSSARNETAKDEIVTPVQRTLYVNRLGHQGTFQTIGRALEVAQGGERILVAPGNYSEAILLTKPVVIIGEGNVGEVTVSVQGGNVVASSTPFGRLQNLALRQNGGGEFLAVVVRAGSLDIDNCEVTSASLSCIGIWKGAEARVRRSRVHGSPQSGIVFFTGGQGVVEECEIFANGFRGITLIGTTDVAIRSNKIRHGRGAGIRIHQQGRALIEDNEIFGNQDSGVELSEGADPTIRRNRIYDGKDVGVYAFMQSRGTIVENDIFGNGISGMIICGGSIPSISNNDIHDNKQSGLFIYEDGGGVIERNQIRSNGSNGVSIQQSVKPQLRMNRLIENKGVGIHVKADGGGVFEGNEFSGNGQGDSHIDPAAKPNVQWKD